MNYYSDNCSCIENSPFSDQNEVGQTMDDNGSIVFLDDVRKNTKGRWQASISVREDVDIGALRPSNVYGGVDRPFHIFPVEVKR